MCSSDLFSASELPKAWAGVKPSAFCRNTGMKIREFYRARPFTDDFGLPARRVVRINAPASTPLYSADRRSMGQLL